MTARAATKRPQKDDRQDDQQCILLVSRDCAIVHDLAAGLSESGFPALTAADSDEARRRCHERWPVLAIIDWEPPDDTLLALARWMNEQATVPVMFVSAHVDREQARLAASHGAICYLVKPLGLPQVVAAAEAALARGADLRELRRAEADLNQALASGREISVAVGIMMERHRMAEARAFELLRSQARSSRRQLRLLARELIDAAEDLNLTAPTHRAGEDI